MIITFTGNIFSLRKMDIIFNPVNCEGVMGKGLALEFKNRFPGNFEVYKKACDNNEVKIGKVLMYHVGDNSYPKFICNFPTKDHWKYPSKLSYIESGMDDFITQFIGAYPITENIKTIAIPALGCGLGGLQWSIVKEVIKEKCVELLNINIFLVDN